MSLDSSSNKDNTNNGNTNTNINNNITLKRSTFVKLAIVGIAALMVSSFLAGYTLHQGISPTYITLPPASTTLPTTTDSTMPTTVLTAPTANICTYNNLFSLT